MKFNDKIKAKEYKQAKAAVKECLSRKWNKSEGEGWITERTFRFRRNKEEKLLPSLAFLSPKPAILNPQPFLNPPPNPQSLHFTLGHTAKKEYIKKTASETMKAETKNKEEGVDEKSELNLHFNESTDSSAIHLHLSSDISSPTSQSTYIANLSAEASLSSPHDHNNGDHNKEMEKEESRVVHKPDERDEDEEINWDAVKILIEADGTSFYGLGENAGSLQLNDLCETTPFENDDDHHNIPNPADHPHSSSSYYPSSKSSNNNNHNPYKQSCSRKGKKGITVCWNTDVGLYSQLNPSLYQSHPFVISLLRDGTASAFYLDSTFASIVHLSKVVLPFDAVDGHVLRPHSDDPLSPEQKGEKEYYQLLFISRSHTSPPLYVIQAQNPQEIAQEITRLFGSISLPPKWALGYQQCRYSYYPDTRVISIAETFRRYNIPCDVIWMDIHYMNEYRIFQFSPRHFPDPARVSDHLHSLGFKGVWMIDPGVKVDENYDVFQSGLHGDHFILRQSPKEPIDPFEHMELDHADDPPSLGEYPEIKESENHQESEEPGFNRAPDLKGDHDDDDNLPDIPLTSSVSIKEDEDDNGDDEDDLEEKVVIKPKRLRTIDELEIGKVWPGDCVFPDFTRKDTRKWWGHLYSSFLNHNGIDGIWNDMNEVASFGEGGTIHRKSWHRADRELGGPGDHSRYHNVYGFLMVLATKIGMRHARKDKREFVLTRANFMGGHRHAATWTGDNTSNWEHLGWTIPMILNLSLSGQLFCGPDIGGFFGDATPELYARWMGIGTLMPFSRAHSCVRTRNHEPWSFGREVKRICTKAIERRYRLLGYIYTLFHEGAHVTSLPIIQPLFYLSPSDLRLRDIDSMFTLGSSILVVADIHPPSTPLSSSPSSSTSDLISDLSININNNNNNNNNNTTNNNNDNNNDGQSNNMNNGGDIGEGIAALNITEGDQNKNIQQSGGGEGGEEHQQSGVPIAITFSEPKTEESQLGNANPSNDDEDMVIEDEHITDYSFEEEEQRRTEFRSYHRSNDRFPSDILNRSEWVRFHVLDDLSDQYERELPELYLRRGSLVPLISLAQYVLPPSAYFLQPISLSFAFNSADHRAPYVFAEGNLYEDEGENFDYQTIHSYSYLKFRVERYYPSLRLSGSMGGFSSFEEIDLTDRIVVYMINLTNQSSHYMFHCDRTIVVTELNDENANHPTPLFQFHQSQFQPTSHPAYPSSKVYSYVYPLPETVHSPV